MQKRKTIAKSPLEVPLPNLAPEVAVAGLATQNYTETAPVSGARVFEKRLTEGKTYIFLAASGDLLVNDHLRIDTAHRCGDRILALLRGKGEAALAEKTTAASPAAGAATAAPERQMQT